MPVSQPHLDRILQMAQAREAQGYFVRVKAGDQRAASLFARLVAYDVNPSGDRTLCGWLSKTSGETNVDGWAEDAIAGNGDQADLLNVIDLVGGSGAPGATLVTRLTPADLKERRTNNLWVAPKPLTADELSYLTGGGVVVPPIPPVPATPVYPSYESLGGDEGGKKITRLLEEDYKRAEKPGLDGECGTWPHRTNYDFLVGNCKTIEASIAKHQPEWRAALNAERTSQGKPPIVW
jgi:hypothetical protein